MLQENFSLFLKMTKDFMCWVFCAGPILSGRQSIDEIS